MQKRNIWLTLLGVEGAVFEGVEFANGVLRLRVRLRAGAPHRCPSCHQACPGYDRPDRLHTWRALELGTARAEVMARLYRVDCLECGVLLEEVPWARQGSVFTRTFEDTVAWLAVRMDKTSVGKVMRVAWATVGNILERVVEERRATSTFPAVTRIGVDEVSYRRGHRYLTVVVDHDTNRLLHAHPGKDAQALRMFFRKLGAEACSRIELVSADGAGHWHDVVREFCPAARVCMDPFHVVKWATDALDEIRRGVLRAARYGGSAEEVGASIKFMRFALLMNPEDLTFRQRWTLGEVERLNKPLFRAYLLKEQLREVFRQRGRRGILLLDKWLSWARRSRLPGFVTVASSITAKLDAVRDALAHGLSNARVESLNTRMQLLTRVAFGFHSADALIALAMAKLGGLAPPLPAKTP